MIVLGEGDCSGRHSSVYVAGEVRGVSANIGTLRVAGEVSLWDSVVRTASIAGEMTVTDSNLQTVHIAGQLNCHGICGGDSISVMGEANADFLLCRIFSYAGFSGITRKILTPNPAPQCNGRAAFRQKLLSNRDGCS